MAAPRPRAAPGRGAPPLPRPRDQQRRERGRRPGGPCDGSLRHFPAGGPCGADSLDAIAHRIRIRGRLALGACFRGRIRRSIPPATPGYSFIAFLKRLASANISTLVKTYVACSFLAVRAISASLSMAG